MSFPSIYAIRNIVSGKMYIGSSKDTELRWRKHRRDLINGKHHSFLMQRAWDKYGSEGFEFLVLEECDVVSLRESEQKWLEDKRTFLPECGYNILPCSSGGLMTEEGRKKISERHKGIPKTEAHRKKLSEVRMGIKFSEEHLSNMSAAKYGKKHSEETKKKVSEARRRLQAKLTLEQVEDIRKKVASGIKMREMSRQYNVSHNTISSIVHFRKWKIYK